MRRVHGLSREAERCGVRGAHRLAATDERRLWWLSDGQPAEIESIVDMSVTGCGSGSPCVNAIFGSTVASFYWSSSTDAGSVLIWGVDFNDGGVASDGLDDRGYSFVRAARGGP